MGNNKNELKVIKTADGSHSVYNAILDENYHSTYGALQESMHIFIKNGLHLVAAKNIRILEVGLGTGLNAALTCLESVKRNLTIHYTALEPFPLSHEIIKEVADGYPDDVANLLNILANTEIGKHYFVNSGFTFTRHLLTIQTFNSTGKFDLVYFDAFAPEKQKEMWTLEVFKKLFDSLEPNGILTTYCAKGEVKRRMKQAGFLVKAVPGPPGKREMTVCYKI